MKGKTISFIGNDDIENPCIRDSNCCCKSNTNKIFKGHISLGRQDILKSKKIILYRFRKIYR